MAMILTAYYTDLLNTITYGDIVSKAWTIGSQKGEQAM
jgi:hypothetical protein